MGGVGAVSGWGWSGNGWGWSSEQVGGVGAVGGWGWSGEQVSGVGEVGGQAINEENKNKGFTTCQCYLCPLSPARPFSPTGLPV